MPEPTIQEVFGPGTSQDAANFIIKKSDLANAGLTISASSRAEAILIAILINASTALSEIARSQDLVNRNVTVQYGGQDLVEQSGGNYRRDVYSVLAYKQTTLQTVDPDDY